MEDDPVADAKIWLEDMSKGWAHEVETITLGGIKVVEAKKGLLRCSFVVTDRVSDLDGNWHVGAMTTLIDVVGEMVVYSFACDLRVSLDFSTSFFATAKIGEEIEVVGEVVGNRESITSAAVEVKRKSNGELIALSKQWFSAAVRTKNVSKL